MNKSILFLFAGCLTVLASCKKDKNEEDFDRKAMLTDMASVVIIPAINSTGQNLADLHTKAQAFSGNPTSTNLTALKQQFELSYKNFQKVKMFDFGPMADYGVKAAMNTYPTDTSKIEANISSGSYLIGSAGNIDAIGFPALDYLLYFPSETEVLNAFIISPNASTRKAYLTDITGKMTSEFDYVVSGWNTYETTFINSDGNDAGSSTSLLFNEFLKDIELIKNAKIGIPAGYQTGGATLPEYVEAYYSNLSIILALENINALKNVFIGGTGIGFDDYIRDVADDETTTSLADDIIAQFTLCDQKISAIGASLSTAVDSNAGAVSSAYQEIKKLVTYCKTDMSSALGLLVTYQDNDGD